MRFWNLLHFYQWKIQNDENFVDFGEPQKNIAIKKSGKEKSGSDSEFCFTFYQWIDQNDENSTDFDEPQKNIAIKKEEKK